MAKKDLVWCGLPVKKYRCPSLIPSSTIGLNAKDASKTNTVVGKASHTTTSVPSYRLLSKAGKQPTWSYPVLTQFANRSNYWFVRTPWDDGPFSETAVAGAAQPGRYTQKVLNEYP